MRNVCNQFTSWRIRPTEAHNLEGFYFASCPTKVFYMTLLPIFLSWHSLLCWGLQDPPPPYTPTHNPGPSCCWAKNIHTYLCALETFSGYTVLLVPNCRAKIMNGIKLLKYRKKERNMIHVHELASWEWCMHRQSAIGLGKKQVDIMFMFVG